MSEVFADTAYFIALFSRADEHHRAAVEVSTGLTQRLVASDWVFVEVADGFAGTRNRSLIQPLVARLRGSLQSEVVRVSPSLFDEAIDLYHQYEDEEWTLTDCTSFLIMRERGITEALTTDHPSEQADMIALLK
jgi:predicted nucleic acid-binding protein